MGGVADGDDDDEGALDGAAEGSPVGTAVGGRRPPRSAVPGAANRLVGLAGPGLRRYASVRTPLP